MKTSNKIFISLILITILGGMHFYSREDFSLKIKEAQGSSLLSSLNNLTSLDSLMVSDVSFVSTLASLNNIKIDTSLFSNKLFLNLKDNRVIIESALPGRSNPFAPISTN